jgi:hypothetical protein
LFSPLDIATNLGAKGARNILANNKGGRVTSQLHVVVCEFAELCIIQSHLLFFGADTQGETWDEVHEEEDDAGTKKGVGKAGDAVSKLVGKLDVVAVEPTTRDHGEAVKMCYVVAGEELACMHNAAKISQS